jgi:hypothetical protein
VEEQVSKAYATKQNPYSEQAKLDAQMIEDFIKRFEQIKLEAVQEFILKNQLFSNYDKTPIIATSDPYFSRWRTQAMLDEQTWKNENNKLKNLKIREIMLALELGANRQELNDMIAKLLEE